MSTTGRLLAYFAVLILGIAIAGAAVVWVAHEIERFDARVSEAGHWA